MPYRMIHENRVTRMWRRIRVEGQCWVWTGARTDNGYGVSALQGKKTTAHRVMYELAKGCVPHGMDLDHLCRNRLCVNPEHLEPVTRRENLMRGFEARGCKNGHPYNEEDFSLVHRKDGTIERRCKLCHRERNKRCEVRE